MFAKASETFFVVFTTGLYGLVGSVLFGIGKRKW
jgi:hypothetical protein